MILESVVLTIMLLFVVPISIYLSAKLGSYGYLKGRQLFRDLKRKQRKDEDKTNKVNGISER